MSAHKYLYDSQVIDHSVSPVSETKNWNQINGITDGNTGNILNDKLESNV